MLYVCMYVFMYVCVWGGGEGGHFLFLTSNFLLLTSMLYVCMYVCVCVFVCVWVCVCICVYAGRDISYF